MYNYQNLYISIFFALLITTITLVQSFMASKIPSVLLKSMKCQFRDILKVGGTKLKDVLLEADLSSTFLSEHHQIPRKSAVGYKLESSPALVLNADYTPLSHMPLSLWYWQDALKAVLMGKARVISEYNIHVRSVRQEFALPSVIVLTEYHRIPVCEPPLSRRNIYIRDNFKCQYCLEIFPPEDLSMDHVIPRSKGGKLLWENTVSACRVCNVKKGDLLPDELPRLGMRLRTVPKAPTHYELQQKAKAIRAIPTHPHWTDYI